MPSGDANAAEFDALRRQHARPPVTTPKGELEEFKGRQIVGGKNVEETRAASDQLVGAMTQRGTEAPNPIQEALKEGYSQDEINAYIQKRSRDAKGLIQQPAVKESPAQKYLDRGW